MILAVAPTPSRPGISTSISTRSGRTLATTPTACSPPSATPTTSNARLSLSIAINPARKARLSSTTTVRIIEGLWYHTGPRRSVNDLRNRLLRHVARDSRLRPRVLRAADRAAAGGAGGARVLARPRSTARRALFAHRAARAVAHRVERGAGVGPQCADGHG